LYLDVFLCVLSRLINPILKLFGIATIREFVLFPFCFFSFIFDRGFELSIHTLSVCKQRRQISVSQMFESQNSFFVGFCFVFC